MRTYIFDHNKVLLKHDDKRLSPSVIAIATDHDWAQVIVAALNQQAAGHSRLATNKAEASA